MLFNTFVFLLGILTVSSQKLVTDYPTLPELWNAETIEPVSPGDGLESYQYNPSPTKEFPSALWSNYTGCQRLIYVTSNVNSARYLLGCDSLECCYEEQNGNQVEFQIPNVHYSNPNRKVDVYHQIVNITNFGKVVEADEWSWSFAKGTQSWKAHTNYCKTCVNNIELLQWSSSALGSEWFAIQFKNYKGYDLDSKEGKEFSLNFQVPEVCQKNNLLKCPEGLHDKYFMKSESMDLESSCGVCGTGYQACCAGFALDGYPCDCHLQDGGSGESGSNCGDCGTGYSACCIGYETQGYPCQCDVL